jgi:hypothetical protein
MLWLLLACVGSSTPVRETGRFVANGDLRVDATELDFGSLDVADSLTLSVTFQNTSETAFVEVWLAEAPSLPFLVTQDEDSFLTPGQSLQHQAKFSPTAAGEFMATMEFGSSDGTHDAFTVALVGVGVE